MTKADRSAPTVVSPDRYQIAYQRIPGSHCFYSTIAGVLAYYQWGTVSEALVMVCSGGLTFKFSEHIRPGDVIPYFELPGSQISEQQLQEFLGVELSWHEEHDPITAWEKTKANLRQDKLQVVAADTYYLPFYERHYLKHHAYHLVTVTGYDPEQAYVSDMLYEGPIKIEDLQKARSSHRNTVLDIRFVAQPALSAARLRTALAQGLAAYAPSSEQPASRQTIAHGQAFMQALQHWVPALQQEPIVLSVFMNQLYFQIIEQVVAPRRLFAASLNDVDALPELDAIREVMQQFGPIADRWTAGLNVLLKGFVYTKGEPSAVLSRAFAHVEAAINDEAEAIDRLGALVQAVA